MNLRSAKSCSCRHSTTRKRSMFRKVCILSTGTIAIVSLLTGSLMERQVTPETARAWLEANNGKISFPFPSPLCKNLVLITCGEGFWRSGCIGDTFSLSCVSKSCQECADVKWRDRSSNRRRQKRRREKGSGKTNRFLEFRLLWCNCSPEAGAGEKGTKRPNGARGKGNRPHLRTLPESLPVSFLFCLVDR